MRAPFAASLAAAALSLSATALSAMDRDAWESCFATTISNFLLFEAIEGGRSPAEKSPGARRAEEVANLLRRYGIERGYLDGRRYDSIPALFEAPANAEQAAFDARIMERVGAFFDEFRDDMTGGAAASARAAEACAAQVETTRPAAPTASAAPRLLEATRPEELAEVIRSLGYRADMDRSNTGNPMIISNAEGFNFVLFFYYCQDNTDCRAVQYSVTFTMNTPPPLGTINDWNLDRIVGQARRTDNGAGLTYFINLDGGVSRENFIDTFEDWRIALRDFARHIDF